MSQDQDGVSAILKALYHGRRDEVEALLASGIELNIFEAAATGQTDRVRELADQNPAIVNAYAPDGFTPLGLAAFFGHAETVATLLAAGADVNQASRETMKMSPLGSAMAVQRNDIARMLIDAGANVNAKAENDYRPLHTAAARGNLESAKLLLEHGADANATTKDGKSPLICAEEHNHPDMIQFLSEFIRG